LRKPSSCWAKIVGTNGRSPDRKIALKFLLAIKGGMEQRQWAALHPAEWERLVEIAPLKRRDSQPT
jgi:hypothetical protein